MNEEEKIVTEDVEVVDIENNEEAKIENETEKEIEKQNQSRKEEFEKILEKIKKMSEAIELHSNVKDAVSKEEVDNNYLKYVENSLEDKLFNDAKFDKIKPNVLLEVVCPELEKIENFEIEKLDITTIGSHFEETENYIDKICTYDEKFICMFGINENKPDDVIKYEARKFSRQDILEAISEKIEHGKVAQIDQYDEYYVVTDEKSLKVFSERKVVALMKIEETVFDKIKSKLTSLFSFNLFSKKKYLPNVQLIYDTNENRFENFEHNSKIDAKSRMKVLLRQEREIVKNTNM